MVLANSCYPQHEWGRTEALPETRPITESSFAKEKGVFGKSLSDDLEVILHCCPWWFKGLNLFVNANQTVTNQSYIIKMAKLENYGIEWCFCDFARGVLLSWLALSSSVWNYPLHVNWLITCSLRHFHMTTLPASHSPLSPLWSSQVTVLYHCLCKQFSEMYISTSRLRAYKDFQCYKGRQSKYINLVQIQFGDKV